MRHVANLLVLTLAIGCAKAPPNTSPEFKVAFYGDRFLEAVEIAQKQTIALVDSGALKREDVTPAIEIFVKIGRGGQQLAAALKTIDETDVTTDQKNAALQAKLALDTFNLLITDVLKDVQSQTARDRISEILRVVQLAQKFLTLWQALAPFLPQPPPTAALFEGGYAYAA